MKFFQKQKVDQIGVTSVALQKILVFLMLLSLFTLFNGGLLSFILCLIGFMGAYKRHTGMLRAYVTISVAIILVAFVFALISSFAAMSSSDYEEYSTSSSSEHYTYTYGTKFSAATKDLYRKWNPLPTPSPAPSASPSPTPNANPTVTPTPANPPTFGASSDYVEEDYTVFIFLAIAVMILAFFVVYLKIFSLVLAYRLRKMILIAATTLPTESTQTHEFAPSNTSCAVPQQQETEAPQAPLTPPAMPFQFTPGFAPYPYSYPYPMMPMMPNAAGQQVPPHVMFGQQPVFYTYTPAPPQQQQQVPTSSEKL